MLPGRASPFGSTVGLCGTLASAKTTQRLAMKDTQPGSQGRPGHLPGARAKLGPLSLSQPANTKHPLTAESWGLRDE